MAVVGRGEAWSGGAAFVRVTENVWAQLFLQHHAVRGALYREALLCWHAPRFPVGNCHRNNADSFGECTLAPEMVDRSLQGIHTIKLNNMLSLVNVSFIAALGANRKHIVYV